MFLKCSCGVSYFIVFLVISLIESAVFVKTIGQVMTRDTFEQKLSNDYVNNGNLKLHVIPLNADLVVDATIKGSVCRYEIF